MHPFDIAATRLYNQKVGKAGGGEFYTGIADCLAKTVRAEGVRGITKGFGANMMR